MNAKRNLIQICLLCAAMLPATTGLIALAIFGLVQSAGAQQYDGYDYTNNADATITITGYTGSGGAISIPAIINGTNVISIGDDAFSPDWFTPLSSLTSVIIPNSITSIGENAFYFCGYMTNVTIGTNVTSIGDNAFGDCGLTSVIIPNSVTNIGESAFAYCGSLTSIIIPTNVTSIEDGVFYGCTSLTNIIIPNSITNIGGSAFYGCYNLTNVIIPNSVTSIGDGAFSDCVSLTNVIIGTNVTSIGNQAFDLSLLANVTIPSSVTNIGDGVFFNCTKLTTITVDVQNSFYSSTNGVLFNKNQTMLVQFPGDQGGSYIIPNGVTSIGDYAFGYCLLTNVTIPNSVTNIGNYAFQYCVHLTHVTIGTNVTSIGNYAFNNCSDLTSITIPNSVTNIGNGAFSPQFGLVRGLTQIYFQGNAPAIGANVFVGVAVYKLPGTTGWGSLLSGGKVTLWNPHATTFSVTGGQFGFNIAGLTNAVIVVEASTNLINPVWLPVATNTMSGSGTSSFSDAQWTNYPGRYYRFRSP